MKKQILILTVFALFASIIVKAQNDACKDVLSYAGRNIITQSDERSRKSYVYQQICKNKYRDSSGSIRAGLDVVIESVPVGFNFGSDNRQQKVDTFCSQNTDIENEISISEKFESLVYGPSIAAWNSCIKVNKQDFRMEPILNNDSSPIFKVINQQVGTGKVEIRRVSVSNNSAFCRVTANGKEEIFKFDSPSKVIELAGGGTANIECPRQSVKQTINGVETEIIPEVSISILTSTENDYQILLPTKNAFLVSQNKMNELLNRITNLENKISTGDGCMRIDKTQICWGQATVSAGTAVWVKKFQATFARPFAEPPSVSHGVNAQGNGHTAAVYSWDVTKTGFSGAMQNVLVVEKTLPSMTMGYVAIGKAVE